MGDHGGAPCPDRIVDDMGSAFAMGAIGGSLWHGMRGFKHSPRGDRFRGSMQAIRLRAPPLGGAFAIWGGLFSTFDCTYSYIRKREDPINSIAAGASTGALLAARAGVKAMATNALIGGVLLGMIEGLGVLVGNMMGQAEPPATMMPPAGAPAAKPQGKKKLQSEGDIGEGHVQMLTNSTVNALDAAWDDEPASVTKEDSDFESSSHPLLLMQKSRNKGTFSSNTGFSMPNTEEMEEEEYV